MTTIQAMTTIRLLGMLAAFLLVVEPAIAANYYIRAGASGANNGTDWTNAYQSLPSTLVRGNTYYIAGGSYSGRTFNTAASGTSVITIKGATIADHGINTGWNNSYSVENTQATWTSGITFTTSYWIFDGSVGPTGSRTAAQYGFKFNPVNYAVSISPTSTIQNITLSHITATAPTGDTEKFFIRTNWGQVPTYSVHNVTWSHTLISGWGNGMWATSAGLDMNDWLVEYNVILDGFSSAANHGEDINNNYGKLNNLTVRYNWFEGRTSGTASIVCLNGPCGAFYIYGNVFKNMTAGDGIITGGWYPISGVIYNNTFVRVNNTQFDGPWVGHDVSATVYNNLIYDSDAVIGGNFTGTNNYNAYFNTTNTPSEPNGQTGTGSPFVNEPGNDLRLSAASKAGITLSTPYGIDIVGNERGADAVWDRGTFEFVSNNLTLLPPTFLRVQ